MTSFCVQGGRGVKKVPKYACILIQSSHVRSACCYMCDVNSKTLSIHVKQKFARCMSWNVLQNWVPTRHRDPLLHRLRRGPINPDGVLQLRPQSPTLHVQVCLIAQFYSGDFSQSRISVRNSALFYKSTIQISICCVFGPTHPTGSLYVSLKLLKQSTMQGRRPFKGSCQLRKVP